jgi:ATP-dependent DNA helicase RecQ
MTWRYAELADCRRRFLLRYFGEGAAEPCGHCDNCDARRGNAGHRPGIRGRNPRGACRPGPGTVLAEEEDRLTVLFDEMAKRNWLPA